MFRWLLTLLGMAAPIPSACGFCRTPDPTHKFTAGRFASICPQCAIAALRDFPGSGGWNLTMPPGARCSFCAKRGSRHLFLAGPGAKEGRICGACLLVVVDESAIRQSVDAESLARLRRMS